MTQNEKNLLFKELCSRLPYGVKVKSESYDGVWDIHSISPNGVMFITNYTNPPLEVLSENCKPYLLPIESMTEEQKCEYNRRKHEVSVCHYEYGDVVEEIDLYDSPYSNDYLIENHFDDSDLIPTGLAVDATGLGIY